VKIAHVAIATPNRCGLYETTHDLAHALRMQGVDARIVDPAPNKQFHPGPVDRGVPVEGVLWARQADVLVDHSGMDADGLSKLQKPIIYINHGRPWSSFIGEHDGGPPVLSYWLRKNDDPRYRQVVTFWPEHVPYLEGIWFSKPVTAIPAPCNLDFWKPGTTPYNFDGKGGDPNVIIADMWRDDIDPFTCLAAFLLFATDHPNAKLHLYGLPANRKGIDVYLSILKSRGQLGVAAGFSKGLRNAYQAGDLLISPHTIDTRTIREAMACGCQVVSGQDANPTDLRAFVAAMHTRLAYPKNTRFQAEQLFDSHQTATKFRSIAEKL